jgi:SAM-dependent methyltransferase
VHDTASITGYAFFRCYGDHLDPPPRILEVGSADSYRTLRDHAPPGSDYIGIDLFPGPGVVASSCLEHDPTFWLTFGEMARVVRPGGTIYASTPSNGPKHGGPYDCWRFYGDAALALAHWAGYLGCPLAVLETFMMMPITDVWIDNVMIFGKPPVPARRHLISEVIRDGDWRILVKEGG